MTSHLLTSRNDLFQKEPVITWNCHGNFAVFGSSKWVVDHQESLVKKRVSLRLSMLFFAVTSQQQQILCLQNELHALGSTWRERAVECRKKPNYFYVAILWKRDFRIFYWKPKWTRWWKLLCNLARRAILSFVWPCIMKCRAKIHNSSALHCTFRSWVESEIAWPVVVGRRRRAEEELENPSMMSHC